MAARPAHCHAVGVVALDQHQLAGHIHDEAGYVNPAMVALTTTTGVSTALAASPQVGQPDGHHTGGVDGQGTGVNILHLGQTGHIVALGLQLVDGDGDMTVGSTPPVCHLDC